MPSEYEQAKAQLSREVKRFVNRAGKGVKEWPRSLFDSFVQELFTHAVDKQTFKQLIHRRVEELREHEQEDRGFGIYAPDLFFINPQLLVRHFVAVHTFGQDASEIEATAQKVARLTYGDRAYENLRAKWMRFHQRELLRDLLTQGFKQWARELRERYTLELIVPGEGLLPVTAEWPTERKFRVAELLLRALVNAQCIDKSANQIRVQRQLAGLLPGLASPVEWIGEPNQLVVLAQSLFTILNPSPRGEKPLYSQRGVFLRCLKFFGLEKRSGYVLQSLVSRASKSKQASLVDKDPVLLILAELPALVAAIASSESIG